PRRTDDGCGVRGFGTQQAQPDRERACRCCQVGPTAPNPAYLAALMGWSRAIGRSAAQTRPTAYSAVTLAQPAFLTKRQDRNTFARRAGEPIWPPSPNDRSSRRWGVWRTLIGAPTSCRSAWCRE